MLSDKMLKEMDMHLFLNLALLSTSVTVLFFVASLRPQLLQNNLLLSFELIAQLPLLFTATFLLRKSVTGENTRALLSASSLFFIPGYAFIVNSIGLLINDIVGPLIALLFFVVNIGCALAYSYIIVTEEHESAARRLRKDIVFISLVLALGIVPMML